MKKFIYPFCILAMCAGAFSSCDKDDDENKVEMPKQMVLATMENNLGNTVSYEFDSNGKILGLTGQYLFGGNGMEKYDYSNLTVKGSYANEDIAGTLNPDSTIANIKSKSQSMAFTYDDSKHIKNISYSQIIDEENSTTRNCNYTWENGDIVNSIMTTGGEHNGAAMELEINKMKIKYTSDKYPTPIENKGNLMLFFFHFSNYMSFISASGVATKHLPVAIDQGSGYEDIEYVFNEDGYPTKVSFRIISYDYTWK